MRAVMLHFPAVAELLHSLAGQLPVKRRFSAQQSSYHTVSTEQYVLWLSIVYDIEIDATKLGEKAFCSHKELNKNIVLS